MKEYIAVPFVILALLLGIYVGQYGERHNFKSPPLWDYNEGWRFCKDIAAGSEFENKKTKSIDANWSSGCLTAHAALNGCKQ